MKEIPFIVQLQRSLPTHAHPWVSCAIRQDELIWRCLQDKDFSARALAQAGNQPEAWSPAALALIALDLPLIPQRLSTDIHYPLDSRLRRKIASAAKLTPAAKQAPSAERGESTEPAEEWEQGAARPGVEDLGQAGLLALALRERRRMVESWDGLPDDLDKISTPATAGLPNSFWKTPLACLLGLIPDPVDMLSSLLPPGASIEKHSLAIHALLANPLPPERATQYLQDLLSRLYPPDGTNLLRALAFHRPGFASQLARYAIEAVWSPTASGEKEISGSANDHLSMDPIDDLNDLQGLLQQAQAYQIAEEFSHAVPILSSACNTAIHLRAELTAQVAMAQQREDPEAALAEWERAVNLSPDNQVYRLSLVFALLDARRTDEARKWMGEEGFAQPPEGVAATVLPLYHFAAARLAAASGDIEHARQFALGILENMEKKIRPFGIGYSDALQWSLPKTIPPDAFPRLLLELGLAKEAARAAEIGQLSRPTDVDLMAVQGEAFARVGDTGSAIDVLYRAVSMIQGRIGLHRQLAGYLEKDGCWEEALEQRTAVCAETNQTNPAETSSSQTISDLRLLANCALQAGEPVQAIDACRKALDLDREDGLSHLYLGRGLVFTGDLQSAQDHFIEATRLAPDLAEPWISLADLQHANGLSLHALETLRAAVQALPDVPEIHLALGEAYLADWEGRGAPSPTQALASFQYAAALAPENTLIALRLGQTLLTLGHLLEARQTLQRAYTTNTLFPGIAYAYAQSLLVLGEQGDALPVLASVVADPAYAGDPVPHLEYARCLLSAKTEPQLAVQSLQHVLSLNPGCVEAQALLGDALAAAGQMQAAMNAYQIAMDANLCEDPIWAARMSLGMGRAALALGKTDIAVAALQEASQAEPHDPEITRSLAEACYAAGLLENALQSARTALRLAPNDLDTLAWFADQAVRWMQNENNQPPAAIVQIRTEALNALTRALQLEPQRADLLVRLGRIQYETGNSEAALHALHQVVTSENPHPSDLEEAAQYLLNLGDSASAVTCLERAISISEPGESKNARLQLSLASAYEIAGNLPAALSTLESAMAWMPEDLGASKLAMYRAKARLLMALDRSDEALACLVAALAQGEGNTHTHDLRYHAARLLRSMGNLPDALAQAETILSTQDPSAPSPYALPAQVLAAELANALLLPERARAFLGAPPEAWLAFPPPVGPQTKSNESGSLRQFEYFCLRAELALDWNDETIADESAARAAELIGKAVRADGSPINANGVPDKFAGATRIAASDSNSTPSYEILHSRLLAIQCRLNILRGNHSNALEILQSARLPLTQSSPNSSSTGRNAIQRYLSISAMLSLGETALHLGQWETAVEQFQKTVEIAPHEPLSHLSLARALVLRAERERLYNELEVIHHASGQAALSKTAAASFDHAIDAAHQGVTKWLVPEGRGVRGPDQGSGFVVRSAPYRRSDIVQAQTMVSRWRARGQAVFQPGSQSAQALSATLAILPSNPEDVAAQIAALRSFTSSNANNLQESPNETRTVRNPSVPLGTANIANIALQAARAYPQHPLVLIQLALALSNQENHELEALNAAQEAVKNQAALNILPVCNALLGRIAWQVNELDTAKSAISSALSSWPDEPRWHALAAKIDLACGDFISATDHLSQAANLENNYLPHFLALGYAYLQQGDPSITLAIHAFEKATRLAPDQTEPWLALAQAQRLGNYLDKAAESADHVIGLTPEESSPHILRAEIALQAGQPQLAYEQALIAIKLEEPDSQQPGSNQPSENGWKASLLMVQTLDRLNRPLEALEVIEKVLPDAPKPLPLLLEKVNLLRRLYGASAASEALQKLATDYPDQPQVMAPLAFDLAQAGQKEKAIYIAQTALQAYTRPGKEGVEISEPAPNELAALHTLLGRLLRDSGQLDGAIHHLNEAIRLTPRLVEPYLELGQALQERRQHNQALQVYDQASHIAPRDSRPYFLAGLALKESKDYMGAENMLRRASALAPDDLSIHRQLGAVVALNLVHNRSGSSSSFGIKRNV